MIVRVKQRDTPELWIHRQQDQAPEVMGVIVPALLGIPVLKSELGGENANTQIELDNSSGFFTRIWQSLPPIRAEVDISYSDGYVFSGIIVSVELGETVVIGVES